jgi:hypothetical protein
MNMTLTATAPTATNADWMPSMPRWLAVALGGLAVAAVAGAIAFTWGHLATLALLLRENVFGAIGLRLGSGGFWVRLLLAGLPSAMIVHHALYLYYLRAREFPEQAQVPTTNGAVASASLRHLYFGMRAIALRYALPACTAFVLFFVASSVLLFPQAYGRGVEVGPEWLMLRRPAALGLAGAYAYIVLLLAQRTFRRDITAGIAMWAAVMPVLGPVVGGVFAFVPLEGAAAGDSMEKIANLVYFAAGMAPRQFLLIAQSVARRFLRQKPLVNEERWVPLNMIRGIDPDIEERLHEEGISDASGLAYSNPFRLIRTTSFDRRQIVDWIDEALLMRTFPSGWKALEAQGITGARRLVAIRHHGTVLATIAAKAEIDPQVLEHIAEAFASDQQVIELEQLYRRVSGSDPAAAQETPVDAGWFDFAFREGLIDAERAAALQEMSRWEGVREVSFDGSSGRLALAAGTRPAAVRKQLAQLLGGIHNVYYAA